LAVLIVGLSMMAGGAWGIWRAVWPSGEEDLLGEKAGSQASIDDIVDIGVWVDTDTGIGPSDRDPLTDRRRGTRIL
jgi:hypothetical protein